RLSGGRAHRAGRLNRRYDDSSRPRHGRSTGDESHSGTWMQMRRRTPALAGSLALAALLAASGAGGERREMAVTPASAKECPAAWREGWQRLANQIRALVYCPTWMPRPLDAKIGGSYANGRSIGKDRSYLVSFVWVDRD